MALNHNIPINIADILIDLSSPIPATELGILNRLGPFFGTPEKLQAHIKLNWKESSNPLSPKGNLIYDPGRTWKMYHTESNYYAALTYHITGQKEIIKGLLCANPDWDNLILTELRTGPNWQSLLNIGASELILRNVMLFTGGIVFHSSALDDNGKGILFVGHSGAGKSTQAELWSEEAGVTIINHDRNAVRIDDGKPICYGTPWGGTENITRNHSAPLSALILVEQAADNYIQEVTPMAAASILSACAYLPYWDASLMIRAMENLNTILKNVPVYRLYCRPEKEVVSLVRSVLK